MPFNMTHETIDSSGARAGRRVWAAASAGLVAAPLLAAFLGARGPLRVALNLGPGDGPYTSGFTSTLKPHQPYEISEGVATHWTSPDASVVLPLAVRGGDVTLRLRFARPLSDRAEVDLLLDGRLVDHFVPVKGFQERQVPLGALGTTPLRLEIRASPPGPRRLGLRMDWVEWDVDRAGSATLLGGACWRPALTIALLVLLLLAAGWSPRGAALLAAPWSVAATWGLLSDPWLVHRLLTWIPEALLVVGGIGVGLGRSLRSRGALDPRDLRAAAALVIATFLLRGAALNHPDYYYPDLLVHFGLVEAVHDAGPDLLRAPAHYVWRPASPGDTRALSGLWPEEVGGRIYRFPYSVAFHVPFTLLPFDSGTVLTAFKLAGALLTTLPLLLVFALARRVGASPLGAFLLAFVPFPVAKLTVAALPALLGDAANTACLVWLVFQEDRLLERRTWLTGAALVAAVQLAYPSGVVITGLVVVNLALTFLWLDGRRGMNRALGLLAMGLTGALVSLTLYYRDFLPEMAVLAGGPAGSPAGASPLLLGVRELTRTLAAWPTSLRWVYPLLAAAGLAQLLRRGTARAVLVAWLLSFAEIQLLRGISPFGWVYHVLFVTPLACLGAGEALAWLGSKGGGRRVLAVALFASIAAEGLLEQWRALLAQLGHAR